MSAGTCIWDGFTNKFKLSKTLRFELKPVGKTKENIDRKGLLKEDERRAKDYSEVKKTIDDYHKEFIEKALGDVKFEKKALKDFYAVYEEIKKLKRDKKGDNKKLERLRKELAERQQSFRKKIRQQIESVEDFKYLFKDDFIKRILVDWLDKKGGRDSEKELVQKFDKWTTYFKGFNENRKNVYSADEIPTSIIYRIVHDNLLKFLDNVSKFNELKKKRLDFGIINRDLKKELGGNELQEVFSLEHFNNCLNQSGIDRFNTLIGGKFIKGEDQKIKGINEYVNLFSQKNNDKQIRSLKLTPLFKQILSDRESASFVLEKFRDDKSIAESINKFYKSCEKDLGRIGKLFRDLKDYSLKKVYVKNDRSLTDISQFLFSDYDFIRRALQFYASEEVHPPKNKEKPTKKEDKLIETWVKKTKYFSVYELETAIAKYVETLDEKKEFGKGEHPICDYFKNLENNFENNEVNVLDFVNEKNKEARRVLEKNYNEGERRLLMQKQETQKIKLFLDSMQNLFHFVKPLYVSSRSDDSSGNKSTDVFEKDGDFYSEFDEVFEKLEGIIPLYNQTRNYVTQKPYSVEKFKLNFENSTLAAGWDLNKETANTAVLFRDEGLFYLGIIDKEHNRVFKDVKDARTHDYYEKVVYKLLPGASKMLPKVFFSDKSIRYYSPDDVILRIRNHGTHTKNGTPQKGFGKKDFSLSDCHKMIDFFKNSIDKHPEWGNFGFSFSKTGTYDSIDGFYREVESQGYKISFQKIDKFDVHKLVEEGKLYLFQIYNKDFSKYSKGRKNLHTLYWNALFDGENLKDVVYKLNGEAELFYRKKSIERKITHPKNRPVENKDPIKGKQKSRFGYDLIKDKRFTEDRFLFHCPITLNFKERDNSRINEDINSCIKKHSKKMHILGIDRGERHLAYYTLLDGSGNILEQDSFNVIKNSAKGTEREVDYRKKLDKVEGDRDEARKNWKKIENIKEMKEGYLSQVVHKIAKIAVEKNAIVVFEDLNFGFKRGRFKIEKQVYQKLEKTLIDKLNYLTFKDRDDNDFGGLMKAYQLTSRFESFKKLGKQSGIIFYVPSFYTSKICPRTGFADLLRPRYENIRESQNFFKSFKSIRYNPKKDHFEFGFNYKDFKEIKNSFDKAWVVCSFGKKLKTSRNKNNVWDTEEIDVTKELKSFFKQNEIEFEKGNELRDEIRKRENGHFFKDLTGYLKLVLQMRNSRSGSEEDYFLSCVADKEGNFFDSRKSRQNEPGNADANGAYNVGLKGLMVLDKIKHSTEGKKPDLKIDNKEFFEFVLGKVKRES